MANVKDNTEILISQKAAYLSWAKAAVTFSNSTLFEEPDQPVPVTIENEKKKFRGAVPWGEFNDLPDQIVEIVGKNPIGSRCLEFKINLSYGSGLKFGRKVLDADQKIKYVEFSEEEIAQSKPLQEIQDFFDNNSLDTFYSELITDVLWFSNGCYQLVMDRENPQKRKIVELTQLEMSFSRWESANDNGIVENHFYNTNWSKKNRDKKDKIFATPAIWSKAPIIELEKRIGRRKEKGKLKDDKQYTYVLPIQMTSPGRKYYPKPYYYSIIASGWMDFANAIPEFKKALMSNQITVKYHIEIHEKYFPNIFQKEGLKTKEAQDKRVKEEFENINKFLKGSDNAGKTWITYYRIDHGQKMEVPDIKIKVIENKLGGEYIEDSQEASAMTYVAMGVHPSLIGVIPGKTNSNLSGSDKRELLRIDQSLLQRLRDQLLKPMYLIKAINKWPKNVHFWFPDLILTTLDQGKEVQQVNNG